MGNAPFLSIFYNWAGVDQQELSSDSGVIESAKAAFNYQRKFTVE